MSWTTIKEDEREGRADTWGKEVPEHEKREGGPHYITAPPCKGRVVKRRSNDWFPGYRDHETVKERRSLPRK